MQWFKVNSFWLCFSQSLFNTKEATFLHPKFMIFQYSCKLTYVIIQFLCCKFKAFSEQNCFVNKGYKWNISWVVKKMCDSYWTAA